MRKLAFVLVLGLTACAGNSLKNDAAALEVGLTAAERIALAYVSQPDCDTPNAPILCSKADVRKNIGIADNAAFAAVMQARNVANDPAATEDAVTAALSTARVALAGLQQITQTLPK